MKRTKRLDKKGQAHMTETIAVLFIFFILLLFGIIFYARYSKIAAQERAEEALLKQASIVAMKALFAPELMCTRQETEAEDFCFDTIKMEKAKDIFSSNLGNYYFDLFGYTTIKVKEINPEEDGPKETVLYDKPKKDWIRKEVLYSVITLKDERGNTVGKNPDYSVGILTIEVYS